MCWVEETFKSQNIQKNSENSYLTATRTEEFLSSSLIFEKWKFLVVSFSQVNFLCSLIFTDFFSFLLSLVVSRQCFSLQQSFPRRTKFVFRLPDFLPMLLLFSFTLLWHSKSKWIFFFSFYWKEWREIRNKNECKNEIEI